MQLPVLEGLTNTAAWFGDFRWSGFAAGSAIAARDSKHQPSLGLSCDELFGATVSGRIVFFTGLDYDFHSIRFSK
jgi:hypothetical protein